MNRTYGDILDAVAADHIANELNLMPWFAGHTPESAHGRKKTLLQTLRSRPALLILVLVIGLALVTGMAYVVGKSMGYFPGVGLVDLSAPVRILKEPVRVQHGGVIIVVDKVIADATRTVVQYHFDGWPFGPGDDFPIPVLRLENGKELTSNGNGGVEGLGWGSDNGRINAGSSFPPLPADSQKAVLVFNNIDPKNKFGPTFNLEIPFSLIPAPKNFITPGVEIGVTARESGPSFGTTPNPTPGTTIEYPTGGPPTPTRVPNGTGLYLDRVIEYEDSYILVGNFTDAGDLPGQFLGVGKNDCCNDPVIFLDAKGDRIPAWPRDDIRSAFQWNNSFQWAYEIEKPIIFPLTIRVDVMEVQTDASATFQFDTGANPQIGQKWKINQHVILLGFEYVIEEVTMTKAGYSITITHLPSEISVDLGVHILGGDDDEGWSTSDISYSNKQIANVDYKSGHIPTGKLTVELFSSDIVLVPGPWTLVWSPPELST
jgi:hypothetical protein